MRAEKPSFQDMISILSFFLIIGICVGVTDGLIAAVRNAYIEYRMAEIFFWTIAKSVNRHLEIFAIVSAGNIILFLILRLAGVSSLRFIILGLSSMTVMGVSYFYHVHHRLGVITKPSKLVRNVDSTLFFEIIVLLFLLLLIWLFVLRKYIRTPIRKRFLHFFTNRSVILWFCLLPFILNFLDFVNWSESPRPSWNLILISIDTLRADHLGCYGYRKDVSPNIDRFAAEGIQFNKAISQSSWTLPAHASLFTGYYPFVHGAVTDRHRVPPVYLTLAEILRNAGYSTAAFTGGGFLHPNFGFKQGFMEYNRMTTLDSEEIWNYIDNRTHKPFFLFLHTYTVHNYSTSKELMGEIDEKYAGDFRDWKDIRNFLETYRIKDLDDESRQVLSYLQYRYDLSILHIDRQFDSLLRGLKERGLFEKTLILFLSDHGEEFDEHGHTYHGGTLFNEQLHVPLLVMVPGQIEGNQVVEEVVELLDVFPTVLNYLGLPVPESIDGQNLIPLIEGRSKTTDWLAFSEISSSVTERYSVCDSSLKLIYSPRTEGLLIPGDEELDVFAVNWGPDWREYPLDATENRLLDHFYEWHERMMRLRETRSPGREIIDPELKERLEALGYL